MSHKLKFVLVAAALMSGAASAPALAEDPVAGCAPRKGYSPQLRGIAATADFTYDFLLVKPTEVEWLAIVAAADRNGDGWLCSGVHDHVNPHFNAQRLIIVDNTNKPKLA